jgi:diguanylate cyclase (GGDEF)-like protein
VLGRRMLMAASTSFLGYGLQAWLLRDVVAGTVLLAWVLTLAAVEGLNGTLAWRLQRRTARTPGLAPLKLAVRCNLLMLGTVWGAVLLLPRVAADPVTLLLHGMGLALAMVLGIYNLSTDRWSYAALSGGLVLPCVVGWLWLGSIPREIAVSGLTLCLVCQFYAATTGRLVRSILLSNRISKDVARQLADSNQRLEQLSHQLKLAASIDPLTACLNRRAMMRELEREAARVRRNAAPFCVVFLDLDHFKAVNDQHGHAAGDAVLKVAAEVFKGQLRATDMAGRWGGEEFVLMLAATSLSAAVAKAEGIRTALANTPIPVEGGLLRITTSVGVAAFMPGQTLEALIAQADARLYDAKAAGRNCVRS